jgi:methionyl-tRNA synthetase
MDDTQRRKFFFMPIPPTPNGRLHLGHIAGPYLRMDVLGRYLRGQGHQVDVVSAVDGFDSYVLWKGLQEDRAPEEVCRDYYRLIARDLASLDIMIDGFLDLVQGPYAERHAQNVRRAIQELIDLGMTECVTERVLYSRATGRYIVGAWLVGRCPSCEAPAAGYFCEACGAHFRPESMLDPRPRLGDADLEWRQIESLFLLVRDQQDIVQRIKAAGAPEAFIEVVRRFLASEHGRVRLTAPGDWGVAWPADRWGNPRVLFEAAWEYSLTCGDLYAATDPQRCHPMRSDGNVTTVVSFGIDNAVLLLASSVAIMTTLQARKPFDHVLTNYFYNLQGAKFSTSRMHVVWAADIVEKTPASSDAVRCFLARESPEQSPTNFDVGEFIEFVNEKLAGTLQQRMDAALLALSRVPDAAMQFPPALAGRLEASMRAFDRAFRLDGVSVRAACAVLLSWIGMSDVDLSHSDEAYGWLKGLSYFAAPLMPRLAAHIWHRLGHEGIPLARDLLAASQPRPGGDDRFRFASICFDTLRPCLPKSVLLDEVAASHG